MSALLAGKRGLIMGVANERSIAWGIAKAMSEAGAELCGLLPANIGPIVNRMFVPVISEKLRIPK